jgi:hypothetical protein
MHRSIDVQRHSADHRIGTRAEETTGVPRLRVLATRIGLRWPDRGVAFDQWAEIGVRMATTADSVAWCLGDWLVYGESRYTDRYRRTIEAVGLNYQTLRNYAWVARRFPLSRRRDSLTFHHHMEVTRLSSDQQDFWLDRAADGQWSVRRLRLRLRQERGGPGAATETVVLPRMTVAQRRLDRWRAAADSAEDGFEHWMAAALDLAADQTLSADLTDDPAPGAGERRSVDHGGNQS